MKWKVEKRNINELKKWLKNPRTISEEEFKKLVESIKRKGDHDILKINTDNIVISGNQRLEAFKVAGEKEDDVKVPDRKLTEKEMEEISLESNRHSGDWDLDKLANEFDAEILKSTGLFDDLKIDLEPEAEEDDFEFEEDKVKTDIKLGDLFQLGNHRLLCGDATKKEDVERLMNGKKADMVLTDPPYGINFEYNDYDDTRDNWIALMNKFVPLAISYTNFFVMPSCGIDRLKWWYKEHTPDWLIVWYKGSTGHLSKIGFNEWEALLVWGKPYKQMHDYFQTKAGFSDNKEHTCPKPVEWAAWLVKRGVDNDGKVMDLFGGSGTTLIACEQLNRKCFMMEIDPVYCQVIIDRWEDFTKQKHKKIE